jgi:hypothetical protein
VSVLTKIFVVLLVICSMLTTAATVVWVNKVEELKPQLNLARQKALNAEAQAVAEHNAALQMKTDAMAQVRQAEGDREVTLAVNTLLMQQVAQANVDIAKDHNDLATRDEEINRMTETQRVAMETNQEQEHQIGELRRVNDKLVDQAKDDAVAIADARALNETLTAEVKFRDEQISAFQEKMLKLSEMFKEWTGRDVEMALAVPGAVGPGAPPINGVIRDKKVINGVTYVTISVGSADRVIKGMIFHVVDRETATFLGEVTIETVDQDFAAGKLSGQADKVVQVRPGDEVKTQVLQGT